MKVILTTSGVGSRLGNLTKFTNKALVRVGNKFAIDHIINNFSNCDNVSFVVTLGYYGDFVKQYLELVYPELNIQYVYIDNFDGPGSSLVYSLLSCKNYIDEPFTYICCDAIIDQKINFNIDDNTLYVADIKDSYRYATVVTENNKIIKINDKGANIFNYIYIGMAFIKDYKLFFEYGEQLYNRSSQNNQLSDMNIYQLMIKERKINFRFQEIKEYYDIGSYDMYLKTCKKFKLDYNVLFKEKESISFIKNKVIKFFYDPEKNKKRYERYKLLKNSSPIIFDKSKNYHIMELIDSKPLSEIYDHGLIYKLLNWSKKNLWIEQPDFSNFKNICKKFYYNKTMDRINIGFKKNLFYEYDKINGIKIKSIYDLIKKVDFDYLSETKPYNFHGDFILDNILFKDGRFYLIDWREDFGGDVKNGDIYYDLSKLRHNIFFNHKNIENNLFEIIIEGNNCNIDLKCNYFLINQLNDYEKFIIENNLDYKKIKILTSLIWINMAPLHEFPLSNFLFNFGKYNLHLVLK